MSDDFIRVDVDRGGQADRRARFRTLTKALLDLSNAALADQIERHNLILRHQDSEEFRKLIGTDDEDGSQVFDRLVVRSEVEGQEGVALYFGFALAPASDPEIPGQVAPKQYEVIKGDRSARKQEVQFVLPFGRSPRPWRELTIINPSEIKYVYILIRVVRKAIPFVFSVSD